MVPRRQQTAAAAHRRFDLERVGQTGTIGFMAPRPDLALAELFQEHARPHHQRGDYVGLVGRPFSRIAAGGHQAERLLEFRQRPVAQGLGPLGHPVHSGESLAHDGTAKGHGELLIMAAGNACPQHGNDVVIEEIQQCATQPSALGRCPGILRIQPGEIDRQPHRPRSYAPDVCVQTFLRRGSGARGLLVGQSQVIMRQLPDNRFGLGNRFRLAQ